MEQQSPNECVPGDGNEFNILEVKLSNYKISSHLYNTPAIEKFVTFLRCNHDKNPDEISILDMREYGMENIQFQLMVECMMQSVVTNLTSLQLKNNEFDHFCCKALSEFIKLSVAFESLDFEQVNLISITGVSLLAQSLSSSMSIKKIKLKNCKLDDVLGSIFIRPFSRNLTCEHIDLSYNSLSTLSSKALEFVFEKNESFIKVNLSYNFFNVENSMANVLRGLGKNDFIEHIDLSWNGARGKEIGKVFRKSLKKSKVKVLHLEHNLFGQFEFKKLAMALKRSKTVEEIYVGDNPLPEETDDILIKSFKSKKNALRLISFGKWHKLSDEAKKTFQDIAKKKSEIEIIYRK